MPRRRYYCEYCEKSFSDNPTNRRNHLNGVQHRTLKKEHYDSFQDPEILLSEESNKKPCRLFFQEGSCKFGRACKYSHMTPEERDHLKSLIASNQQKRNSVQFEDDGQAMLDDWLKNKRRKLNSDVVQTTPSADEKPPPVLNYSLPVLLSGYASLPPSFMPPKPEDFSDGELEEWG